MGAGVTIARQESLKSLHDVLEFCLELLLQGKQDIRNFCSIELVDGTVRLTVAAGVQPALGNKERPTPLHDVLKFRLELPLQGTLLQSFSSCLNLGTKLL